MGKEAVSEEWDVLALKVAKELRTKDARALQDLLRKRFERQADILKKATG